MCQAQKDNQKSKSDAVQEVALGAGIAAEAPEDVMDCGGPLTEPCLGEPACKNHVLRLAFCQAQKDKQISKSNAAPNGPSVASPEVGGQGVLCLECQCMRTPEQMRLCEKCGCYRCCDGMVAVVGTSETEVQCVKCMGVVVEAEATVTDATSSDNWRPFEGVGSRTRRSLVHAPNLMQSSQKRKMRGDAEVLEVEPQSNVHSSMAWRSAMAKTEKMCLYNSV
jgi:hypothetical protein